MPIGDELLALQATNKKDVIAIKIIKVLFFMSHSLF